MAPLSRCSGEKGSLGYRSSLCKRRLGRQAQEPCECRRERRGGLLGGLPRACGITEHKAAGDLAGETKVCDLRSTDAPGWPLGRHTAAGSGSMAHTRRRRPPQRPTLGRAVHVDGEHKYANT